MSLSKLEPATVLILILNEFGLDHQGAIGTPFPGCAEAKYMCYNESQFLFVLNGTKLACDWVDVPRRDPWSVVVPFQEPVFTVDLHDPKSIRGARDTLYSYMKRKKVLGGGHGEFFKQVFKRGTGCTTHDRAH